MHGLKLIPLIFLSLVAVGCATLPADIQLEMAPPVASELNPFAPAALAPQALTREETGRDVSRAGPPDEKQLTSGQLLVWSNLEAAGLFVNLFAAEFSPWTHIGVISVESDGIFVYDTNANLQVSADRPAQAQGPSGMQRTPFQRYVNTDQVFGLYAPPREVDAEKLVRFVRDHHRRGTPFDARFDSADPSELYCSELIALGFVAAGAAPLRVAPVRSNRSYDRLRSWLDISAEGFYLPGQLVDEGRQVAVWSQELNRAQIDALFAARKELASRFDAQARLGQLLQWNPMALSLGRALDYRDTPKRFIGASLAAFAQTGTGEPGEVSRHVRLLANLYFGTSRSVASSALDRAP